jgi:putative aldouronate transport system permease protein
MVKNVDLYIFILPMLIYLIIFNYAPMYGLQIAFKDFVASYGITGSPWVGLKHFQRFLRSPLFLSLFRNTLMLSIYQLVFSFPIPIMLALILKYAAIKPLARLTQTITYAPHFISIVVMVGMLFIFFDPSSGLLTLLLRAMGLGNINVLTDPKVFRHLYVWSGIWQNTGWASVIYIAALSNSDPELHQAAIVDGANLFQRVLFIDIPVILPTAVILLILNCGNVMNLGFEKVFLMQTSPNLSVSEVISTYVYKIGLQGQQYSYASAIGLFNNIINFVILITVNGAAKKMTENSLW